MTERKSTFRRWLSRIGFVLAVFAAGPLLMAACGDLNLKGDWRTATRDSAGIAPDPETTPEAVVQVYAGRAFRWRGIFGVHTWIATKPADAPYYTVHQVMGWYARHGGSSIASGPDIPDRHWFGARPELLADLRGEEAAAAIPKILEAIETYPHEYEYVLWPGPNSNTFAGYVARACGLPKPPGYAPGWDDPPAIPYSPTAPPANDSPDPGD